MLRLGMELVELARFDWGVGVVFVLGGLATLAWTAFMAWEIAYLFAS